MLENLRRELSELIKKYGLLDERTSEKIREIDKLVNTKMRRKRHLLELLEVKNA